MKNKVYTQPDFEMVPLLDESAFLQRRFYYEMIDVHWHQHPELEITYIENVSGKRIIGNDVSDFNSGDLTLIGSNLPHLFKEDTHSGIKTKDSVCHVIQFSSTIFNREFLSYSELGLLNRLFENANYGIFFHGEIVKKVKAQMSRIEKLSGIERFTEFFRLLGKLAVSSEYEIINKEGNLKSTPADSDKIKTIYNYILEHYTKDITIEHISRISNLSKGAFCNYFKRKTKKRFSTFVNELRIDLASKLLFETDLSIAEIAHKVGYENLSYFNRKFFEYKNLSPSQYKRKA